MYKIFFNFIENKLIECQRIRRFKIQSNNILGHNLGVVRIYLNSCCKLDKNGRGRNDGYEDKWAYVRPMDEDENQNQVRVEI